MAILNSKLRFLLIGYSFIFSLCDTIHDLKLDNEYHGLSTKGNLTSDLYRVKLDPKSLPPAIRVAISSENATTKNPLSVEVIHGNTIHHIALPRVQSQVEKSFSYWFASDTLCDYNSSIQELESPVYLYILSSEPATFDLRVKSVPDFNIGTKPVTTLASPSEPRYYKYTFPDDVEKVDMKIESNSQLCGKVIVRRVNCPLFDAAGLAQLNDIYFYQTFTTFGGFSLLKSFIGPEFHLAFTVLSDDSVCGTQSNSSDHGGGLARIKSATISVTPVKETSFWSSVPILLCTFILCIIGSVLTKLDIMGLDIINDNNQSEPRRNSETGQSARQNIGADDDQMGQIDDAVYIIPRNVDEREEPSEDSDGPHARIQQDERPLIEGPRVRVVSHKEYQESVIKESAYFNFYFFQLFGSILPGLTTLFYKQQQASNYMNLDTCYLNYLCYSDVFIFNSMNGMLSAFSLAIVGIFNLFIVFRNISLKQDSSDQPEEARQPNVTGVQERKASKVVVLLGLVALGFQWAIINDCPHKITIHLYIYTCSWLFYSAFMWIYSLRHGVKKWQQYYIIGVSSAFGCITMAKNTFEMTPLLIILINIAFSITAMLSTGYFCFKYIYDKPPGIEAHQWIEPPDISCCCWCCCDKAAPVIQAANEIKYTPLESKFGLVVILMIYSSICSLLLFVFPNIPVYTMCFWIGKGQVAIYLIFYISQKIKYEWSTFSIKFKIVGTVLVALFLAGEIFNRYLANYHPIRDVLMTPAKSRELNRECFLSGLDWNDARQYNCAINCFVFIILIDLIEWNLKEKDKKDINVF